MYIVDNFLTEDQRFFLLDSFTNNLELRNSTWQDFKISNIKNKSINSLFVKEASKIFNLKNMVGIESWVHYNVLPSSNISLKSDVTGEIVNGWHYDKDEKEFQKNKIEKFPLCSLVYYIEIKNLINGNFLTQTEKIKPMTNRLLIFGPKVYHSVEKFEGSRIMLGMAFWDYKINL